MDIQASLGPSIQVASRVFTDIANLKILKAGSTSATHCTFINPDGTDYQVPVGKVFRALALKNNSDTPLDTIITLKIGYGTSVVGWNNATPPAGLTYLPNATSNEYFTGRNNEISLDLEFPAACYPSINSQGGTFELLMYGYEE